MTPPHPAPLWLRALACLTGGVLSTVFAFILLSALDALEAGRGLFLFGPVWDPCAGRFGIAAMIHASFLLAFSSLAAGWFLSLGCCCMLQGVAPRPVARGLMGVLRFMSAVPTVVYGFAATFALVPLIRGGLGGTGFCWLAAASMLALQGVPTMTLVMEGAMRSRSAESALTAAALGMTPLQHLARVTIPASRRHLVAAAVLGFGRALGDTLPPAMLAGNAVQFARTPLDSLRSLTAHIGLVLSSDIGGGEHLSLLLAGGLLLAGSVSVSLLARRLTVGRNGNEEKYR